MTRPQDGDVVDTDPASIVTDLAATDPYQYGRLFCRFCSMPRQTGGPRQSADSHHDTRCLWLRAARFAWLMTH